MRPGTCWHRPNAHTWRMSQPPDPNAPVRDPGPPPPRERDPGPTAPPERDPSPSEPAVDEPEPAPDDLDPAHAPHREPGVER